MIFDKPMFAPKNIRHTELRLVSDNVTFSPEGCQVYHQNAQKRIRYCKFILKQVINIESNMKMGFGSVSLSFLVGCPHDISC